MDLYIMIPAFIIFLIFLLIILFRVTGLKGYESPEKRAGRIGEQISHVIIKEVLKGDDVLLSNVRVCYDGKETELDNVVINNRGVFIIEVKNWSGDLIGDEEDYDWIKNKYTPAGNFYHKTVKNPIKQVERQIYILANYLKEYGVRVWVEGYVFFLENNSPIVNEHVLRNQRDMDRALHYGTDNQLSKKQMDRIISALNN